MNEWMNEIPINCCPYLLLVCCNYRSLKFWVHYTGLLAIDNSIVATCKPNAEGGASAVFAKILHFRMYEALTAVPNMGCRPVSQILEIYQIQASSWKESYGNGPCARLQDQAAMEVQIPIELWSRTQDAWDANALQGEPRPPRPLNALQRSDPRSSFP